MRLVMRKFLMALVPLLSALPAVAMAQPARSVLVVNSGEASLSVIDLASQAEKGRIPVLREPHHVMLTPDGQDLLLGDTVANELLFLDPATFAIKRRMTVADPYQMGFSPDGRMLVVNGLARAQVDVFEAGSYKLLHRFPLKSMPSHVDFSPDSSTAFVSLQGTGKLTALDLRTMTVKWTTDVGTAPAGVLWNNGRVLVAIMGQDDVVVVNPATGAMERRVKTGKGAHQLFHSPDGKLIYANNRVDSTSVVLDAATLAVVRTYKIPGGPDDLVFAPDGRIWYTLRFAREVGVLDPKTGAVQTIAVGRSPHGIFIGLPVKPVS
jgi:YVTN family beta-propeller protein